MRVASDNARFSEIFARRGLTIDFGGNDDKAYGVALQADGKIVVAGTGFSGSSSAFAAMRFNPDGSLEKLEGYHTLLKFVATEPGSKAGEAISCTCHAPSSRNAASAKSTSPDW